MKLPPAVIVHGLDHARQALAPGRPVTLLSAEGAGAYAGVGWWQALMQAAADGAPPPTNILDCGAATGRALEAIRAGQRLLVVRSSAPLFEAVAARLAQAGGCALAQAPPALDLAHRHGALRLDTWLTVAAERP